MNVQFFAVVVFEMNSEPEALNHLSHLSIQPNENFNLNSIHFNTILDVVLLLGI
jgi:hypothetical protein